MVFKKRQIGKVSQDLNMRRKSVNSDPVHIELLYLTIYIFLKEGKERRKQGERK